MTDPTRSLDGRAPNLFALLTREGWLHPNALGELGAGGKAPILLACDSGLVSDESVATLIAREIGAEVVDLAPGAIDVHAMTLMDERTSRLALAVVLSVDREANTIRVAFADPLDRTSIAAVVDATGLTVVPVVARLRDVRAALAAAFGPETEQPPPLPELASEATLRVGMPAQGTLPVIRIEDTVRPDQCVEALLLALIDRGVLTRSDFRAALERLLASTPSDR